MIISNHPDLKQVADRFGIDFFVFPINKENKAEQEAKELELLKQYNINFVVLARYMQVLSPQLIDSYPDRIINIHHSFLPAFAGAKPYHGDAFQIKADVLILKYAQFTYGLDRDVVNKLETIDSATEAKLPKVGGFYFSNSHHITNTDHLLFIGVPPLRQFGYKEIREFGRKALISIASSKPQAETLLMTIHERYCCLGVGAGRTLQPALPARRKETAVVPEIKIQLR